MRQEQLPDHAIVIRGGRSTPSLLERSIANYPGGIIGVAVVSAPGQTIEELSKTIPHRTIRTSTIATIRSAGGDVIPSEGKSPFFAVLVGWQSLYITGVTEPCSGVASVMSHKQGPHIFADFNNADKRARVRLNCKGTLDDMASLGLTFHDGMHVVLDDGDEIAVDAIVRYCPEEIWVAEVD